MAEEHIEEGRGIGKVREGLVSDASNSRGIRMRDPLTLTPEILAIMVRHEPDKAKHAKLLKEYLTSQRTLPSTKEELQQNLERKAKRETNRLLAAEEADIARQD